MEPWSLVTYYYKQAAPLGLHHKEFLELLMLRKLKDTKGNVTLDEFRSYLEAELPRA